MVTIENSSLQSSIGIDEKIKQPIYARVNNNYAKLFFKL